MSARALKLLADSQQSEVAPAPPSPVLGKLRYTSAGVFLPSAPPGLEATGHCSEQVEGAESSSGSTYFDDAELAPFPSDARFWGQAQLEGSQKEPAAVGGTQTMILATTPLSPPIATDWSFPSVCPWAGAMAQLDMCYPGFDDGNSYALPEALQVHVPVPEQPPPSLPATLGSAAHEEGTCKPCAFVYTKGCQSGLHCAFCHLCPPGEKDRRKKVKHIMARIRRRAKPGA
ncbi:unnamed protein product [Symbiodinium sp. CCMP2456]|nr:unnamed protein product [Symbiodinium sp. CCMP2456]